MNLPVAYLLGIAALLLAESLHLVLPGSGQVAGLLLFVPGLAVPPLLSLAAVRRIRQRAAASARDGWSVDRITLLLLRLAVVTVPLAYVMVLVPGGYLDLADRWAGESFVGSLLLLLLPLLAVEIARNLVETVGAGGRNDPAVRTDLRARLAIIGLFTVPWFMLSVTGDLLRSQREIYLFGIGTTVGLTLGVILFIALLGFVLPLLFRLLFGLSTALPEPLGTELRETAGALGFPGRAVLWLDSSLRVVNALLLGPLPWPRYLVVTDGLAAVLDREAMRGVVAHEVGHAQAGHPMLLMAMFVLTPVLLTSGVQAFDTASLGETELLVAMLVAMGFGALLLRQVAHRFEHEADVLSAIALGGAEPCIRALQRVGHVIQQAPERGSMLHPSEGRRVRLLRSFAEDARFRARFTLRGLYLRRAIGAATVGALLVASWSWIHAWPLETAMLRFLSGDLRGAQQQVDEVGGDVPSGMWDWWERFREDLDAAIVIAGDGGEWETLRPRLAEEGWRRGIEAMQSEGPAVARRWFSLATEDEARSPLRRSLLMFCEAARVDDAGRMALLAEHIRSLGAPPELSGFFGS